MCCSLISDSQPHFSNSNNSQIIPPSLKTKTNILTVAYKVVPDPGPVTDLPSSPLPLSLPLSAPATLESCCDFTPTSGPLYLLSPLPGMPFPETSTCFFHISAQMSHLQRPSLMDQLISSDHFLTPTLAYFFNFCLALFFISAFGSTQHFMLFVYFLFLLLEYQSAVGKDCYILSA